MNNLPPKASKTQVKQTHFRTWKSGKFWLYGSMLLATIAGGTGVAVTPLLTPRPLNASAATNQNQAGSATALTPGKTIQDVGTISANALTNQSNWTFAAENESISASNAGMLPLGSAIYPAATSDGDGIFSTFGSSYAYTPGTTGIGGSSLAVGFETNSQNPAIASLSSAIQASAESIASSDISKIGNQIISYDDSTILGSLDDNISYNASVANKYVGVSIDTSLINNSSAIEKGFTSAFDAAISSYDARAISEAKAINFAQTSGETTENSLLSSFASSYSAAVETFAKATMNSLTSSYAVTQKSMISAHAATLGLSSKQQSLLSDDLNSTTSKTVDIDSSFWVTDLENLNSEATYEFTSSAVSFIASDASSIATSQIAKTQNTVKSVIYSQASLAQLIQAEATINLVNDGKNQAGYAFFNNALDMTSPVTVNNVKFNANGGTTDDAQGDGLGFIFLPQTVSDAVSTINNPVASTQGSTTTYTGGATGGDLGIAAGTVNGRNYLGLPGAIFAGRDFHYNKSLGDSTIGQNDSSGADQIRIAQTTQSLVNLQTTYTGGSAYQGYQLEAAGAASSGANPVAKDTPSYQYDKGTLGIGAKTEIGPFDTVSLTWKPSADQSGVQQGQTRGELKLTYSSTIIDNADTNSTQTNTVTYPNLIVNNNMTLGVIGTSGGNTSNMTVDLSQATIQTNSGAANHSDVPAATISAQVASQPVIINYINAATGQPIAAAPSTTIDANIGDKVGVEGSSGTLSDAWDYTAPALSGFTFAGVANAQSLMPASSMNAASLAALSQTSLQVNQASFNPNTGSFAPNPNVINVYYEPTSDTAKFNFAYTSGTPSHVPAISGASTSGLTSTAIETGSVASSVFSLIPSGYALTQVADPDGVVTSGSTVAAIKSAISNFAGDSAAASLAGNLSMASSYVATLKSMATLDTYLANSYATLISAGSTTSSGSSLTSLNSSAASAAAYYNSLATSISNVLASNASDALDPGSYVGGNNNFTLTLSALPQSATFAYSYMAGTPVPSSGLPSLSSAISETGLTGASLQNVLASLSAPSGYNIDGLRLHSVST